MSSYKSFITTIVLFPIFLFSCQSGKEVTSLCSPLKKNVTVDVPNIGTVIWSNNFNDDTTGTYTVAMLNEDWNTPQFENGVSDGRVSIVDDSEAYEGKSLCVKYPVGTSAASDCGAHWPLAFNKGYEELYCSYMVKFKSGFNFVRGGKIPGFAGGTANTGGHKPDGSDGWSARMMWRTDGKAVQYVYYPDQLDNYGQDFDWDLGGQRYFTPGTWHKVEHRIVMNTPGKCDGIIQTWFDGECALNLSNIRFRDVDSFAIDGFFFSTFFGGHDSSWAPTKDEYAYFDNFIIAEINH